MGMRIASTLKKQKRGHGSPASPELRESYQSWGARSMLRLKKLYGSPLQYSCQAANRKLLAHLLQKMEGFNITPH